MSEYMLFFLGAARNRLGRPIAMQLASDTDAREQARILGKFFDGAEVWQGGRLICHIPVTHGVARDVPQRRPHRVNDYKMPSRPMLEIR